MAELINNVPTEIIIQYFDALDLKTAIKFASCSKTLHNLLGQYIVNKERETVINIFTNLIQLIKSFYQDMTSIESRNGMLSFMLRKLIHTTAIYDTVDEADLSFPHYAKYYEEYNDLFLLVNEEIMMDHKEFNVYMENAQFEYRGFNIVGLPIQQRQTLNAFKHVIETRYFSQPYKVQLYLAYDNNAFVEMIFDGEYIEFDFHMRRAEDGQWIFIDQEISRLNVRTQYICMNNRMLFFHFENSFAIAELVNILFDLFTTTVTGHLVKGAEQSNVSIWNNVYEDNAILAETIHHFMSNYHIETKIHDIANSANSVSSAN